MTDQEKNFAGKVKFNFYTYDPAGRDVVITLFAKDEDDAWNKFDRTYGRDFYVDMVISD